MKTNTNFYKKYSMYGLDGYYIPVRNSFNNSIEREFIPAEAKEKYESKFGNQVITDQEFMEWYTHHAVNL